jgi:hypothetical protein
MNAEDALAWAWTVENVRLNPMLMNGDDQAGMIPWLIEKIGLRGAGLNVFLRKVGLILEMFKRIDAEVAVKE